MKEVKNKVAISRRWYCERGRRRVIGLSVVIGVVILIALLLFWVDIADVLGWGDGGA